MRQTRSPRRHHRGAWRGALPALLVCLLAFPVLASLPARGSPARPLGRFHLTYYYIAQERLYPVRSGKADWPLFGPACRRVLAYTSRAFHEKLSLEGTGLLRDGRLVNFEERCSCARPGYRGQRLCYTELDRRRYPWGRGARLGDRHMALAPFRSLAVDPVLIPVGSVLYLPALRGRRRPDGRLMDGCFRAEDSGAMIQGRHLDLFAGTAAWADWLRKAYGLAEVTAVLNAPRCAALALPHS